MKDFIQRHGRKILAELSGLDRMRFRGSLRPLTTVGGTLARLVRAGVLLQDGAKFAQDLTDQVRQATELNAIAAGRPVRYLDHFVNKEALVQRIRDEQGLAAGGLIKRVPRRRRYLLTQRGAAVVPTLLATRNATLAQLTAA